MKDKTKAKSNENQTIQFSVEEFNALRNETVERISIMNTQASSAIGVILTTWGAGFGLLGIQIANSNKLSELSSLLSVILSIGQIGAFYIAILVLLPMAIKSGENLVQMVSLGVYIRVFFNYLSQHQSDHKMQNMLYAWETADKQVNEAITPKGKGHIEFVIFNSEYTILGGASLFFLFGMIILSYNVISQYFTSILLYFLYGSIILSAIFFVWGIYHLSNSKKNLMEISEKYTQKYLTLAVELGYISKKEIRNAWNELNPSRKINEDKYSDYFK